MADGPWLTIVGLGEDGLDGLPPASLAAIENADVIMGPARHLALLGPSQAETLEWPVPFADGVDQLLALRGQRVTVLASGDPFWFGAGSVLARQLEPMEWTALPAPSCFSLAASRLGWPLETTVCLGLHAAPFDRLRPHLGEGVRCIVTLREGESVATLADYLTGVGFGDSRMHVLEALGGPFERLRTNTAADLSDNDYRHPVCVAIETAGGSGLPRVSGLPDDLFENDGQITKRPVRALTLSALAPRHGEHLWDIGGGSGSVAIEWLLAHPSVTATTIEADPARVQRIERNARNLGVDRLQVATGSAPEALDGLDPPQAVFIGGGLSQDLLSCVAQLAAGTRVVANAVTLEGETLLSDAQLRLGGALMRVELAHADPLGQKRGWRSSFPIVQWSVTL